MFKKYLIDLGETYLLTLKLETSTKRYTQLLSSVDLLFDDKMIVIVSNYITMISYHYYSNLKFNITEMAVDCNNKLMDYVKNKYF